MHGWGAKMARGQAGHKTAVLGAEAGERRGVGNGPISCWLHQIRHQMAKAEKRAEVGRCGGPMGKNARAAVKLAAPAQHAARGRRDGICVAAGWQGRAQGLCKECRWIGCDGRQVHGQAWILGAVHF